MAVETKLTKKFVEALEARGAVVVPYVASRMQPSGYPDRIVSHPWWFGWLELKGWGTRVQLNQKLRARELDRRQPGTVFVFRFSEGSTEASWSGRIELHSGEVVSQVVDCPGVLLATLRYLLELRRAEP